MPDHIKDYSQPLTHLTFQIDEKISGSRLDSAIHTLLPHRSRTFFKKRIEKGLVTVNSKVARASSIVQKGDVIQITIDWNDSWVDPLSIPLDIIYESSDIIVLNKGPKQLVHPTGVHQSGTLLNALHARHKKQGSPMSHLPRVLHRLDQDTSGVLMFAKSAEAAAHFGQAFENRLTTKIYLALLEGSVAQPFTVDAPLDDDSAHPVKVRQWVKADGKSAHSEFTPLASNQALTLCSIKIRTGRLHQIRVHAAYSNRPIYGDALYNSKDEDYTRWTENRESAPKPGRPDRQLLHAWQLKIPDPSGHELRFEAPLPDDFRKWAPDLIKSWENNERK